MLPHLQLDPRLIRANHYSVLDLKASCRGSMYVLETLKLLPEQPDEDIMAQIVRQVASLGRIHPPGASLKAA